mgnify:CR=1 FL=1
MGVPNNITNILINKIKIQKMISARKIASELQISEAAVGKWLKGGSIELDKIPKLCKILEITPNELFGFSYSNEDNELLNILHNDLDLKQFVLSRQKIK